MRVLADLSIRFNKLNDMLGNYSDLVESGYVINFKGGFACSTSDTNRNLDEFPDQDILGRLELLQGISRDYAIIPRNLCYAVQEKVYDHKYISIIFKKYREGYFVINLNYDAFANMVNYRNYDPSSRALLVNEQGMVLADSSETLFGEDVSDDPFMKLLEEEREEEGEFKVSLSDGKKNVHYCKKQLFGINYMILSDAYLIGGNELLLLVHVVIAMIINLILILLGTCFLYGSIDRLKNLLGAEEQVTGYEVDEFQVIEQIFNSMRNISKEYSKAKRWPGIRIHHSKNLKNWELIEYPLSRMSQLDLRGVGASQGVWAPCLTYNKGVFYLVYTVVRSFYCNMHDTENYLVMARDIHGPWSEPVALNNFGFDPSLFHDDDGRKYMVSMVTDHRVPKKYVGRLVLQEYDPIKECMTGPVRDIYKADRIFLEGPHIFKRKDWYYLFAADTGTGEGHGQSMLRARNIWGPYEMFRADFMERRNPNEAYSVITSRHHEDILLQKSGHCDLVETREGEWYAVHLCGRASCDRNPLDAKRFPGSRRYMIGRETAIQRMRWTEDDWLVLDTGNNIPQIEVDLPKGYVSQTQDSCLGKHSTGKVINAGSSLVRDDFTEKGLHKDYQSLRIPMDEHYISLSARPGWLRMYGRSGLSSKFSQTLIARRMTEYQMETSACMEFEPEVFKQMAGLIFLYDTDNYLYLHVSRDEDIGKCITLLKAENKKYEYLTGYLPIREKAAVYLKAEIKENEVQFYYGYSEKELWKIGPVINAGFLSDEACDEGWFTGAMLGICCQDLTGFGKYADFDYFEVKG